MASPYPAAHAAALPSTEDIRSIAGPTIIVLAVRAATPVLFYLLGMVGVGLGPPIVYEGIRGVLSFAGVVLYFVWFARVYNWLRAARGGTSFSTGLAIGGWFIPVANLVLPFLGLNDAWKRAHGSGSPLVLLWWIAYLIATATSVTHSIVFASGSYALPVGQEDLYHTMFQVLGWSKLGSQIVAYGLWAHIVREITTRVTSGQR
jgi:hypothetical protein